MPGQGETLLRQEHKYGDCLEWIDSKMGIPYQLGITIRFQDADGFSVEFGVCS